MNVVSFLIDFILHMDRYLGQIVTDTGMWTYVILFIVIFIETGLVVTPFLPGDSLLFVVGALSATGALDLQWVILLLMAAAFIGDNTNYWIGRFLGPRVFKKESRWLNRAYLNKTEAFYEKHGGKTVLLARFLPILRTFAPFVAGIGRMRYAKFLAYSIAGGTLWVGLFGLLGYFFGGLPVVKENFSIAVLAIIVLSLTPMIIEVWKARARSGAKKG